MVPSDTSREGKGTGAAVVACAVEIGRDVSSKENSHLVLR